MKKTGQSVGIEGGDSTMKDIGRSFQPNFSRIRAPHLLKCGLGLKMLVVFYKNPKNTV